MKINTDLPIMVQLRLVKIGKERRVLISPPVNGKAESLCEANIFAFDSNLN